MKKKYLSQANKNNAGQTRLDETIACNHYHLSKEVRRDELEFELDEGQNNQKTNRLMINSMNSHQGDVLPNYSITDYLSEQHSFSPLKK